MWTRIPHADFFELIHHNQKVRAGFEVRLADGFRQVKPAAPQGGDDGVEAVFGVRFEQIRIYQGLGGKMKRTAPFGAAQWETDARRYGFSETR